MSSLKWILLGIVVLCILPMLYVMLRGANVSWRIERTKTTPFGRKVIALVLGAYGLFMLTGAIMGYASASPKDRLVHALVGLFAGAFAWLVACLVAAVVARVWLKKHPEAKARLQLVNRRSNESESAVGAAQSS